MTNVATARNSYITTAGANSYEKFFADLRDYASQELLQLLRSIDKRVSVKICDFIANYLRGVPADVEERKNIGDRLKTLLAGRIKILCKAAAGLRKQDIELNRISCSSGSAWLTETRNLADTLERHAEELSVQLAEVKRVYNEKRFGIYHNHYWLILLQECVELWTEREEGGRRSLRPEDIADLLTAGKAVLGWSDARTETDVENTRKALQNFRRNPANHWISNIGVKQQAEIFCRDLKHGPFFIGIEI